MAYDDPFTLDLFGASAPSGGVDLGVTAFAGGFANEPEDDPNPNSPAPAAHPTTTAPISPVSPWRGVNFHLDGDRGLAAGWKVRARDNIAAIRLAAEIEAARRPATEEEQRKLIRFVGFGASALANGVFRQPGELKFQEGWGDVGADLQEAVTEADYLSLARCTQYVKSLAIMTP
jgi:hypothetical protein